MLLGLKDQDYPGTKRLEDWPTWTLPVLRWAKAQGAVAGFAHSGWGLEVRSRDLPNYEMPAFDGIGANEYIVDVTHPDAVDFISAGDTPYIWELNIWYHTLNAGFRTRISGETDFPCITDDRVGLARSYAKVDGTLTYRKWIDAVQAGRSLRVRRQEPPDGLHGERRGGRHARQRGSAQSIGPGEGDREGGCEPRGVAERAVRNAAVRSRTRTGTSSAPASGSAAKLPCKSSSMGRSLRPSPWSPMGRSAI